MTDKWKHLPVGTHVRCADPEDFHASYSRKLRNRVGTVRSHQQFSGNPIIEFAKEGNRKPFQWVPADPRWVVVEP